LSRRIYRKAARDINKKKEVKYIVAKRFQLAKKGNRPGGSKRGPFKVVDPRMKKDNRAQKKTERRMWNRAKGRQKK
jgi:AdoMet-dependent rRNA methyltransferase SPB1